MTGSLSFGWVLSLCCPRTVENLIFGPCAKEKTPSTHRDYRPLALTSQAMKVTGETSIEAPSFSYSDMFGSPTVCVTCPKLECEMLPSFCCNRLIPISRRQAAL